MKMQNMKIVQKWREYAGPKDERLEAENAKIYEFGFILLSFGMLALLAYEIIAQQVAWVHNGANDAFHLFASPVDAAMRCIAEAQIVPFEDIFWAANLATGVVFGVTIFAATFGALCLAFYEAKHRRAKIEAELDATDER